MPTVSVRIPQIGEGLQEARLVAVLKQPGERVKRDEPIYQMETDKAVMDVESPYEGILVEWLAEADQVLPIGAEVARMEVEGAVKEEAPTHGTTAPQDVSKGEPIATAGPAARNANIPPRTRAYAKEKGVSEEVLATLSAASGKLMPSDIDAYLAGGSAASATGEKGYEEHPMHPKQRVLASRLVRGSQLVVPGTMSIVCPWEAVEAKRNAYKSGGGEFQPSAFTIFAYCVAQTLKDFPTFRSSLIGDDTVRTYHHASLGIAVALPGDDLVLAVVEDADTLEWEAFAYRTREKIELARQGNDQANERVTLSITNLQSFGVRDGVPVVVPPGVATLFLGEVYVSPDGKRVANIALTIDHRLINGVGGAQFLNALRDRVTSVS